jgi:hypothetical protein
MISPRLQLPLQVQPGQILEKTFGAVIMQLNFQALAVVGLSVKSFDDFRVLQAAVTPSIFWREFGLKRARDPVKETRPVLTF